MKKDIKSKTDSATFNTTNQQLIEKQYISWSWRVSLEPFYKISQDIKYHVISYLSLSFINLNIS